ncbi:hypothetical protein AGIG_G10183 [Arapaima gigas]
MGNRIRRNLCLSPGEGARFVRCGGAGVPLLHLPPQYFTSVARSSWGRPHVRSPVGDAVAGRGLRRENSSSAVVPSPGN